METLSRHAKIQTSETFLLSAILALSGGFQDAYTYNVRNGVFSNAQTGNVVLMSQHLMEGNWMRALHYLFPVLAFAFGVLVAERIGHTYKNACSFGDNQHHCTEYARYSGVLRYSCRDCFGADRGYHERYAA